MEAALSETVNNKTEPRGESFQFIFLSKKWNLRRILLIFIHSLLKSKELPQSLGRLCSHIEHCARTFGREGLVNQIPNEYSLPSQWIPVLVSTYSFPLPSKYLFTLHQSEAQNSFDRGRSTFEIGAAKPTPLQETRQNYPSYVWTQGLPGIYGFHADARAIRYTVSMA